MNKLEQLKTMTTIVIDTGDIDAIKKHSPTDATTNPSLVLSACSQQQYLPLIDDAVAYCRSKHLPSAQGRLLLMDKLYVNFGYEITKIIPGRVSTELDPRLSFDVEASIARAKEIIALYEEVGVGRERILIKLASTWEGARAAEQLEKMGIHCNMTLLFSLPQAIACADAKATLISPFVGRILDWYKKSQNVQGYPPAEDPGVVSVREIYNYLKKFDYKIQVMGASFRNVDEILELAGSDLLTIAPNFLEDLSKATGDVVRKLNLDDAKKADLSKIHMDEKTFRWMLNENAMATEKLSEGIRRFAEDAAKLEKHLVSTYNL